MQNQRNWPIGLSPIRIDFKTHSVKWANISQVDLGIKPFYSDYTNHILNNHHLYHLSNTDTSTLLTPPSNLQIIEPAILIFHISRCGSTLLSNMLAESDQLSVKSEMQPINAILLEKLDLGLQKTSDYLIGLSKSFENKGSKKLVIKLSSWNVLYADLFRKIFPNTYFIFLYRSPIEVIVSNLMRPRGWMKAYNNLVKVEQFTRMKPKNVIKMSKLEYCTKTITEFMKHSISFFDDFSLAINYSQISPTVAKWIVENIVGLQVSHAEFKKFTVRSRYYAKDRSQQTIYQDDSYWKQTAISTENFNFINQNTIHLFSRLEDLATIKFEG